MSRTPISFGAFASVQNLKAAHGEIIVAANQGDLEGAIYARFTSEPKDIGHGQSQATMVHEFVCTDGSTISTTDVATITQVPVTGELSLTVQHTVHNSTGRFEGRRGTFPSFGIHQQDTGKGVQRFSGTLS